MQGLMRGLLWQGLLLQGLLLQGLMRKARCGNGRGPAIMIPPWAPTPKAVVISTERAHEASIGRVFHEPCGDAPQTC